MRYFLFKKLNFKWKVWFVADKVVLGSNKSKLVKNMHKLIFMCLPMLLLNQVVEKTKWVVVASTQLKSQVWISWPLSHVLAAVESVF